jgi:hypothetical protein
MRFRLFMLLLASSWSFLPTTHANAAQEEVAIAPSGNTVVGAVFKKKTVDVTIRTVRIESSNSAFPWGLKNVGFREITIVQSLEISVDGKHIWVPRSVFGDLFNPLKASVGFEKGLFVLTINGGDASESYFIRVYFDDKKVSLMETYSSLDNALTSDTRYYYPVL